MIELMEGTATDCLSQLLHRGSRWRYCLSSPPYYGLVDYSHAEQIGHEATADDYIEAIAQVCQLIYEGMQEAGVLWLNIADTRSNYSMIRSRGRRGRSGCRRKPEPGVRQTGLIGIPHRLLEHIKPQGWHHHQTYTWWRGPGNSSQPQDGRAIDTHELIYVLGKSRFSRPQLAHRPLPSSVILHPPERATDFPCKMPQALADNLLSTATCHHGTVIDPFIGSGTTAIAALRRGFDAIGIDVNIGPAQTATCPLDRRLVSP
jgi:hypothetical protein